MRLSIRLFTTLALPVLAHVSQARGQSGQDDPAMIAQRLDPVWTVQVEPSVWYVAPSGKVKLPVSSGTGPGSFTTPGESIKLERLNLDTPRFEPAGEIHLSSERWRFSFSGSTYGLEREGTTADSSFRLGAVEVAAGDAINVELDFTSVELTGGYRIWDRDFKAASEVPENAFDAVVRVYALGGARFYDVSFDLANRSAGGAAAADEFFGEPIVGLRGEADFGEDFSLDLQISGGGFADSDRSSLSLDIVAGFQWHPTRYCGVQIGYRQLAFGLADGDELNEFEYNGRLAGLFAGLVLRF